MVVAIFRKYNLLHVDNNNCYFIRFCEYGMKRVCNRDPNQHLRDLIILLNSVLKCLAST